MREIKFRAWDGIKMNFDFIVARPQAANCLSVMTDEAFAIKTYRLKEWKLMQYTGLKDIKGVEIYEGDILGGYPHGEVEVRWQAQAGCWEAYWTEDSYDEEGEPFTDERSSLLSNELSDCFEEWSVLGNIYQNPELAP